jgi:hypothetical protein
MSEPLLELISERLRQIEKGFTPEHDDGHRNGELVQAACSYALGRHTGSYYWPWENEAWHPEDQRRNLIKAAALILAEIERLDRLERLVGGDRQGD